MRNIKLTLAYDGANYHGWQLQAPEHGPTIQGVLEDKLQLLTKQPVRVQGAGRTDAGVHALGQVASFATESRIPAERFPLALNSVLPPEIVALEAGDVSAEFNARFSAVRKTYRYHIYHAQQPSPFWYRYAWHVPNKLDLAAMEEGARLLTGTRDFRSFCASGSPVKNFVRTVDACRVEREGNIIQISITADGFLYNMVRIIVGTLVEMGKGKRDPGEMPGIIDSRTRVAAGTTAPPQGLFLVSVEY